MIEREHSKTVKHLLQKFPAAALLGPRQCGKTTLARQFDCSYFDMEVPGNVIRLDAEWETLISADKLIAIDEAQTAPDIFPRLRAAIDADRQRKGRFLLLGSVSPELMINVAESLAGRLSVAGLTPFILPELTAQQLDALWLFGGFPDGGILDSAMFPEWQQHYLDLLIARDLPNWGLPSKPQQTERLLAMLAVLHGQLFNASQLGTALGLNYKTVQSYVDFLEGAYVIRKLHPFHTNIKKRLIKAPRVFWRDSGLMHAIMNVHNLDQLYNQPWVGQSWEGFVIEQTLAVLSTKPGNRIRPYFFRTSDGYELDLVLDRGTETWAVEIKLTSSPSPSVLERMNKVADMISATKRILICRTTSPFEHNNLLVTDLWNWLDYIR